MNTKMKSINQNMTETERCVCIALNNSIACFLLYVSAWIINIELVLCLLVTVAQNRFPLEATEKQIKL